MAKSNIRSGSMVTVVSGEHKGRSGRVLEVNRDKQRLLVEGVNVRKSAVRRSQDNPQGGIVEKECPIHMSNVMLQEKYDARKARREAAEAN